MVPAGEGGSANFGGGCGITKGTREDMMSAERGSWDGLGVMEERSSLRVLGD